MRIERFEVHGLLGREGKISFDLNRDMNIVTGRNGAGKTSVLKLMWYLVSGNILHALREVPFTRATIKTSEYEFTIVRTGPITCRIEFAQNGRIKIFEDEADDEGEVYQNAEDLANSITIDTGRSVFLPTFRRIEGGFTITNARPALNALSTRLVVPPRKKGEIEEALNTLSRSLSNGSHVFVSAISTGDIVQILMRKYADLSEEINNRQSDISQKIVESIKNHKGDINSENQTAAEIILDRVRSLVESMDAVRDSTMAPIEEIRNIVESIFKHTGIQISGRLSFGDAANAVNSESLSAGEKQMLSFICYNALYSDCPIFIDEPELSLHVDWQRQLFPILQRQTASNQFIVATHSPFIYGKYPDKEILIVEDRGDAEVAS